VGCVQRNQSYCCFNSKLARILQEQGRAQIPSIGGFGSAQSPNCRGFTTHEFQSLDFTKIDLTGYHAQIRTKGQALIQGEAQDAARRRLIP
jgi:conjugal transfer mating pair stabilization protein TraN